MNDNVENNCEKQIAKTDDEKNLFSIGIRRSILLLSSHLLVSNCLDGVILTQTFRRYWLFQWCVVLL